MANTYVNIKTDTLDNIKVPTKDTFDKAVLTDAQTLTDAQKTQVKTNIGILSITIEKIREICGANIRSSSEVTL